MAQEPLSPALAYLLDAARGRASVAFEATGNMRPLVKAALAVGATGNVGRGGELHLLLFVEYCKSSRQSARAPVARIR
jgi:hypothetical protein